MRRCLLLPYSAARLPCEEHTQDQLLMEVARFHCPPLPAAALLQLGHFGSLVARYESLWMRHDPRHCYHLAVCDLAAAALTSKQQQNACTMGSVQPPKLTVDATVTGALPHP